MELETAQPTQASDDSTAHYQSTAPLVRARLPTESFALAETLATVPDLQVTCASHVATGEEAIMPLVWFQTPADDSSLAAALEGDPTVAGAEQLVNTDDRSLYRIEWTHDIRSICQILLNSTASLLDATANERYWCVEILYSDREALQETSTFCEQYNVSFEIEALRTLDPELTTQCGLTAAQYEALTVACRLGYFAVPREADLNEVAETIGISHQALSERLRRAHETLITAVLGETTSTLDGPPVAPNPK